MSNILKFKEVEEKILTLRNQSVILDSDVAALYGVETKRVNEAVKNNPNKFPEGYLLEVMKEEKKQLVENFDRFNQLKHSTVSPVAFTEKGLYMLATILKGPKAEETTLSIVETFANIRELSRTVAELSRSPEKPKQKALLQKGGEIMADILGDDLQVTDTETSIEINFALMKFKHTVKQGWLMQVLMKKNKYYLILLPRCCKDLSIRKMSNPARITRCNPRIINKIKIIIL